MPQISNPINKNTKININEFTNILLRRTRSDEYVSERDGTASPCSLLSPEEAAGRRAFLDKVDAAGRDWLTFLTGRSDI